MENKVQLKVDQLRSMSPVQLVENEAVQAKFVTLYDQIHGKGQGEAFFTKEKFNFLRMISENESIRGCSALSLYGTFLDIAVNGLSLEGGSRPLVYVIPRNFNVGTRENAQWEKRACLVTSPYGELYLRMKAGHVKHVDNPVVVYEGDQFEPGYKNGQKIVNYVPRIPRVSSKIVGGFVKITRRDGSVDFQWMLEPDLKRLAGYSAKQNKGRANELYTSNDGQIDPGFFEAKLIRHAFKTYPKLKTGQFTQLETELVEQQEIDVDYGIEIDEKHDHFDGDQDTRPAVVVEPVNDGAF